MFKETQTVMIVKSSGREASYAQRLFQVIGKLPTFESSQPITEDEYRASSLTIDGISNEKTIFLETEKKL